MDDRYAGYVIAVGELCAAAELAGLRIEVVTTGGHTVAGLPVAPRAATADRELDGTGLQRTVRIDDSPINLDEIVRCTVHPPEPVGASCQRERSRERQRGR